MLQDFSALQWLRTAEAESVTNALVVPTMLAKILEEATTEELPALRTLAYGGAPMPRKLIEGAMRRWPHVDFVNAYGLTETSSTISVLGPEDHRLALSSSDPEVRARLSSAGQPLPGVEIEVRDESGGCRDAGERGRIWVKGAQVSAEYAGVGALLDERGFFDTRDEGFVDASGYLFVGGRTDDTIIRGAENIAPAEIEDVLLQHPEVSDVAVVGVPDDTWGQRIEAVVIRQGGSQVTPDQLRAFAQGQLRSSKTPERIEYWESLPRTDTGKLIRRAVLEQLLGQR